MKSLLSLIGISICAAAQIVPAGSSGIRFGHLHVNAKDGAAHQKFWVDVMGAQSGKLGQSDLYRVPGTLIVINKVAPSAGTQGSVVDHVSFKVRDLKGILAKAKAMHVQVLNPSKKQATLVGPDDLRVVLTIAGSQPVGVDFHTSDVKGMKDWYESTFGTSIPGVELRYSIASAAPAGTKGRVLDHIGFEVKDLEAFTRKLEATGVKFTVAYRKIPQLGIAIAFFTDAWGTYIELTEGLDKI